MLTKEIVDELISPYWADYEIEDLGSDYCRIRDNSELQETIELILTPEGACIVHIETRRNIEQSASTLKGALNKAIALL